MSIHIRTLRVQILTVLVFVVFFVFPVSGEAEVFQSSNFRVLDPVVTIGAERSTSTNFILLHALGEPALGTSSATNFQIIAGFLPFPTVTLPVPTATAGDASVSLSWTAATGFLGWTVSNYNVGQATISGGPYTYTTVGNVTSATASGLSNGTTYYFIVRPQDFFGNSIGTSTQVSAVPVLGATPTPSSKGGGGPPGLITVVPFLFPVAKITPGIISPETKQKALARVDFNGDGKVDIADLSMFLYRFEKPYVGESRYDLDKDGTVDIIDLSILFYYWGLV